MDLVLRSMHFGQAQKIHQARPPKRGSSYKSRQAPMNRVITNERTVCGRGVIGGCHYMLDLRKRAHTYMIIWKGEGGYHCRSLDTRPNGLEYLTSVACESGCKRSGMPFLQLRRSAVEFAVSWNRVCNRRTARRCTCALYNRVCTAT